MDSRRGDPGAGAGAGDWDSSGLLVKLESELMRPGDQRLARSNTNIPLTEKSMNV